MAMTLVTNPDVKGVFKQYPQPIKNKLLFLRDLIIETASQLEEIKNLQETLRWGEPSYIAKQGSTIRINAKQARHKDADADQVAMYFNCKTKLVDTFRELYSDIFVFEGNRAIVFECDSIVPVDELKHCIELAFTYHRIKHLPLLGV